MGTLFTGVPSKMNENDHIGHKKIASKKLFFSWNMRFYKSVVAIKRREPGGNRNNSRDFNQMINQSYAEILVAGCQERREILVTLKEGTCFHKSRE